MLPHHAAARLHESHPSSEGLALRYRIGPHMLRRTSSQPPSNRHLIYEMHAMELTNRLQKCYAASVHDVLRAMGHAQCVLPHTIKPLDPERKLAGEIYTVSGYIDQTRDAHDTLVQWTGLLSRA